MDIHRYEKIWIVVSLLLIVGFIGTVTYGAVGYGVKMVGDEGGQINTPTRPTQSPNFKTPGVYKTGEGEYDVYLLASQFFYRPGTQQPLRLPADSTVTFHLTSPDVIHGFEIVGTNINTMAIPGQVGRFTVRFERPARYGIICHEYCGVGHHLMEGLLEVVPRSQFETPEGNS